MYQVQRMEHFILQISQSPKALPVLPGGVLDVTLFQDVPRSVMAVNMYMQFALLQLCTDGFFLFIGREFSCTCANRTNILNMWL